MAVNESSSSYLPRGFHMGRSCQTTEDGGDGGMRMEEGLVIEEPVWLRTKHQQMKLRNQLQLQQTCLLSPDAVYVGKKDGWVEITNTDQAIDSPCTFQSNHRLVVDGMEGGYVQVSCKPDRREANLEMNQQDLRQPRLNTMTHNNNSNNNDNNNSNNNHNDNNNDNTNNNTTTTTTTKVPEMSTNIPVNNKTSSEIRQGSVETKPPVTTNTPVTPTQFSTNTPPPQSPTNTQQSHTNTPPQSHTNTPPQSPTNIQQSPTKTPPQSPTNTLTQSPTNTPYISTTTTTTTATTTATATTTTTTTDPLQVFGGNGETTFGGNVETAPIPTSGTKRNYSSPQNTHLSTSSIANSPTDAHHNEDEQQHHNPTTTTRTTSLISSVPGPVYFSFYLASSSSCVSPRRDT
ncbi:hypothetical protein Pmani_013986 [Petrolisthes manimaculis]|uniref:Uncharacterized protein n=1 Tax=Petrolisthes manimaculis TaxID=1843537 RepID=A0AAE1U8T9_9EUCA|nr:hypothetical protein Pmani_013986 [Petrolisthes manimaculis]